MRADAGPVNAAVGNFYVIILIILSGFAICCLIPLISVGLAFAYSNESKCLGELILDPPISITLKIWIEIDGYTQLGFIILFLLVIICLRK